MSTVKLSEQTSCYNPKLGLGCNLYKDLRKE